VCLHRVDCIIIIISLVYSLVLTRLEYGNSVLAGLPVYLVRRLQSVQNAAARLTYHLRRSDHITDALVCLHWLRVPERVQYKIAILVYKVLHGLAPQYLGPLNCVADLPGRRPLRSAGTNRLAVPPVKLTTVANQPGFPDCRPTDMERSIPDDVTSAESLSTFRQRLKTRLFTKSFFSLFLGLDFT